MTCFILSVSLFPIRRRSWSDQCTSDTRSNLSVHFFIHFHIALKPDIRPWNTANRSSTQKITLQGEKYPIAEYYLHSSTHMVDSKNHWIPPYRRTKWQTRELWPCQGLDVEAFVIQTSWSTKLSLPVPFWMRWSQWQASQIFATCVLGEDRILFRMSIYFLAKSMLLE